MQKDYQDKQLGVPADRSRAKRKKSIVRKGGVIEQGAKKNKKTNSEALKDVDQS